MSETGEYEITVFQRKTQENKCVIQIPNVTMTGVPGTRSK